MKRGHLICVITLLVIIGVIFLSGCISHSEEYEKIEQMEFEKDIDGLIDALNFNQDSNYSSSCRARAARGLGEIGDAKAVEPLIRILESDSNDDPGINDIRTETVKALAKIGEPSIEPLIQLLEDEDYRVRIRAMDALGMMEDERTIPVLIQALPHWYADWGAGKSIAGALDNMGWKPNSTEEEVHYLVAKRDKYGLKKKWAETKQVLLNDVESDNREVVKNAVYAFIAIGNEEIIPDLIAILDNRGNVIMAETYLNSGNKKLDDAARDWARRNGYKITSGYGASDVNWGSM